MFTALGGGRESVALLQAYLFDDPKEIDGVLGWKSREKIREKNGESTTNPANASKIPAKKPGKTPSENKEVEKGYTLSKGDFDSLFQTNDFAQET
jgi:hypothetical protein